MVLFDKGAFSKLLQKIVAMKVLAVEIAQMFIWKKWQLDL